MQTPPNMFRQAWLWRRPRFKCFPNLDSHHPYLLWIQCVKKHLMYGCPLLSTGSHFQQRRGAESNPSPLVHWNMGQKGATISSATLEHWGPWPEPPWTLQRQYFRVSKSPMETEHISQRRLPEATQNVQSLLLDGNYMAQCEATYNHPSLEPWWVVT